MKNRIFTADETFTAEAEILHFGPRDLANAQPDWTIRDARGNDIASGLWPVRTIPTGTLTPWGSIHASFAKVTAPAKLTVTVSLKGTTFANDWDIWVYPASVDVTAPAGVVVSWKWDDATIVALARGKKVVLFPQTVNPSQSLRGSFLPVFWSPIWFPKSDPKTMSILCDRRHPALAQFPTEFYTNWQWYDLLQNSRSVILNDTPASFPPIVEVIDNFARNDKLGNLFEARVGGGSPLVCSMDLLGLADSQPAAKQFLDSLYAYARSESFAPREALETDLLDMWFSPTGRAQTKVVTKNALPGK